MLINYAFAKAFYSRE